MKRILFVCSGNTCRSPMAEFMLRHKLDGRSALEIKSAGIFAGAGLPATYEAIEVMAEKGVDIRKHRSQVLNQKHLDWADLVLTMTDSHRKHILTQFSIRPDKVYTLAAFAGKSKEDIKDPFGMGLEAYRETAEQLQLLIDQAINFML